MIENNSQNIDCLWFIWKYDNQPEIAGLAAVDGVEDI